MLPAAPLRSHLASLIEDCLRHGQDVAVVSHQGLRRRAVTYGELAALSGRFAAFLEAQGVRKGDRLVLCGENCAEWIAAFFGCVLRGVVVVPLDAAGTAAFVTRVAADVAPRIIAASRASLPLFADSAAAPAIAFEEFASRLPAHPLLTAAPTLAESDPLQIIYTSGTTAEPKGVVHTHHNVLASVRPIETEMRKYLRYERWFHPLRFLHTLPLSHVFGQFMGLWLPPLLGAALHFPPRLIAGELVETIHAERISVVAAVPRLMDLLRAHLLERFPNLPARLDRARTLSVPRKWWLFRDVHAAFGLKFWAFVCGGAALAADAEQFWLRLGFAVVQGYGMTETTALVSLNHPFKAASGTLGKVMPGREIQLTGDGEILVRGETVAASVWQGGQPVAVDGGWVATGDLASLDEQGNLRFRGRKKEVIVTAAGLNIYPEDVEAALDRQPGVRASVVVGIDGAHGPEPVAALISLSDDAAAAAVRAANATLAEFQRVRRWVRWPEPDFPRTSNGKLLRRVVAARLSPQEPAAAAAGADALEMLVSRAAQGRSLPPGDATRLDDVFDSLGRLDFAASLEERFGLSLTDLEWSRAATVGDLRAIINRGQPSVASPLAHAASGGPAPPIEAAAHAYPTWPWNPLQHALRALFLELVIRPVTGLLAAPRIERRARLLPEKPALIVPNHVSAYDVPLVLFALPSSLRRRVAVAMSGEMLLDFRHGRNLGNAFLNALGPVTYLLLTGLFNIFPLPQRSSFAKSFRHAAAAMDRGYHVIVFPEGRRSDDGTVAPFQKGSGLLWHELRCPALPVYLSGLGAMKTGRLRWFRSGRLKVVTGKLLRYPETLSAGECTQLLEQSVIALDRDP